MPTYIVLLGPPGAGKGTQAKIICDQLGIPQVSTGDLFRAMKTQDTPFARKVQEIMARGSLVPDEATIQMVKDRLHEADCANGAVLDGFPRTAAQADALEQMLTDEFKSTVSLVPFFQISLKEAVRRISGRRTCETCQAAYHVDDNPPRVAGVCDVDQGKLYLRPDDAPEVVE